MSHGKVTGKVQFTAVPVSYNYENGDQLVHCEATGGVAMVAIGNSTVTIPFIDSGVSGKLTFDGYNVDLFKLPRIGNKTRLRITIEMVEYD